MMDQVIPTTQVPEGAEPWSNSTSPEIAYDVSPPLLNRKTEQFSTCNFHDILPAISPLDIYTNRSRLTDLSGL